MRASGVLVLQEPPGSTLAPPTFCNTEGMREGVCVLRAGAKPKDPITCKMEKIGIVVNFNQSMLYSLR